MSIYTTKPDQAFDAEFLRQELVAVLGSIGWHINTAGNQVEFVGAEFEIQAELVILSHFNNATGWKEQLEIDKVQIARQSLYTTTSDPILFKFQRGAAKKYEWMEAVFEIKESNPLPFEPTIEQKIAGLEHMLRYLLEWNSAQLGYDDYYGSVLGWAGYANAFQTEATTIAEWGSKCWAEHFIIMQEINSTHVVPSPEDYYARLPVFPFAVKSVFTIPSFSKLI